MFTKALKVAAGGECSLLSQWPSRLALADPLVAGLAPTQQFVAPYLKVERGFPALPLLSPYPPSPSSSLSALKGKGSDPCLLMMCSFARDGGPVQDVQAGHGGAGPVPVFGCRREFLPSDLQQQQDGHMRHSLLPQGPLECVIWAASLSMAWPIPLLHRPWGEVQFLAVEPGFLEWWLVCAQGGCCCL